jgi:hypothetical protein
MDALHEGLSAKITSPNNQAMNGAGLVGALEGARVKLLKSRAQHVMLPRPQRVDGQVPVCFAIRSTPRGVVIEYRIQKRGELNDILSVTLKAERGQEIQLEWSALLLVAGTTVLTGNSLPDTYRSPTECAQADSATIQKLAEKLWPERGSVEYYVRNIQRFIREMKQANRPSSLDALGILESGMNTICTADANLAVALLRAKGIPSRSMAVIPPIARRLEMHRIVEFRVGDQRHYFDPSSLHADVPMKPWQTVIMARTTLEDENQSMNPRMGAMLGCPYAQEAELLSSGLAFAGQDFYWTMAKPLAEFDPDESAVSLATDAWAEYLREGLLSEGQVNARAASDSSELTEILNKD